MKPDPRAHAGFTVCDPACGTGGFLVSAYEWFNGLVKGAMDRELARRVKTKTYFGQDLVARPRRLALMNLYLHCIDANITLGDTIYVPPTKRDFDVILTNPPFGTRAGRNRPRTLQELAGHSKPELTARYSPPAGRPRGAVGGCQAC